MSNRRTKPTLTIKPKSRFDNESAINTSDDEEFSVKLLEPSPSTAKMRAAADYIVESRPPNSENPDSGKTTISPNVEESVPQSKVTSEPHYSGGMNF